MAKRGISHSDLDQAPVTHARLQRRRAMRLLRRGEERKALQLLRECAALEPVGSSYCWLADILLKAGREREALDALRQALYCFRYDRSRGRACAVAQWILRVDPSDDAARKVQTRALRSPEHRAA